jgi:hypothetical protein
MNDKSAKEKKLNGEMYKDTNVFSSQVENSGVCTSNYNGKITVVLARSLVCFLELR